VRLSSAGLRLESAQGRWRLEGELQADFDHMASRLSTLPRLGSYRLSVRGGGPGSDAATVGLATTAGPLLLSGEGQWTGARLRLRGEARAEDGSEAYTRRGDFSVSADGVLQNGDGRPVIGDGGPVTVPPGGTVTIGPDGTVLVGDPQNPTTPPQPVARLKLVSVEGSRVGKGLDGLFRVPGADGGAGALPQDEEARLTPGALEQSNVDPTRIIVDMVEAQRLFEMRTHVVATAREVDEKSASLMRLNT
jgi:flagellar basal body rod protein FlgF